MSHSCPRFTCETFFALSAIRLRSRWKIICFEAKGPLGRPWPGSKISFTWNKLWTLAQGRWLKRQRLNPCRAHPVHPQITIEIPSTNNLQPRPQKLTAPQSIYIYMLRPSTMYIHISFQLSTAIDFSDNELEQNLFFLLFVTQSADLFRRARSCSEFQANCFLAKE